ncbi:GAF domain-containing protein [Stigmatella aurantiaca]|uniref:histidine kinase n=1 Tax=Stigmatella aurantiaca TaxID=41 RepID=A0A1H7Z239_STIAU|nr:GAF domain-containing sensor histidine kinase [Stigmatella aurantiaca]SEM52074.1 GAF domain-containing protein [Stigmatella aurantiaca]
MASQETPAGTDQEEPERRLSRLEAELQRTQAQLARRNRQLELLALAARELNSSRQNLDIMRRLVWLAMELVDAAEGVWGRLIDGRMVIVESLWREGKAIEPRHVVFAPNEGVPGHVMVTREPYISNDAARDVHVLSHLQKSRGFYNLIDLPLFARSGELLGCFELHDKKDHQPFTQEDLELLKALRGLAGVALENAHLANTVQFERRTLEMIVQQMPAGFTLAEAPSGRILYSNGEADRLLGHPIDRADQMITDLLDVNRIRAGLGLPIERAPMELRQVVAGTLQELSTLHGERFLLRGEARVQGTWDARALCRAVENLCGNAIKYGDPVQQVTVSLKQEGGRVELAVHNWGMPISPAEQAHLFQSFRRTRSAEASGKKGWGIGLTLVRGVAEAHGGSVSVESTEEAGTTFRLHLPTMPPG